MFQDNFKFIKAHIVAFVQGTFIETCLKNLQSTRKVVQTRDYYTPRTIEVLLICTEYRISLSVKTRTVFWGEFDLTKETVKCSLLNEQVGA